MKNNISFRNIIFILFISLAGIICFNCGEGDDFPLATVPINTDMAQIEVTVDPLSVSAAAGDSIMFVIKEINGIGFQVKDIDYTLRLESGAEDISRRGYFTSQMFINIWDTYLPPVAANDSISAKFHTSRIFDPPTQVNSLGIIIVSGTDDNSHTVTDTAYINFQ